MATYRYQVISVGMWRGKVKRWNTTFHVNNTTSFTALYNMMQALGWKNPGDTVGACSGGVAEIAYYTAAGGPPVGRKIYFDWETPGTWIPYTGTAWSGVDPDTPIDASGESALVIVGNMGTLSATGKPVTTRKYFHAIPSRTETDFTLPDIDATSLASIQSEASNTFWRNPAGSSPASLTVLPYYGNHQRVRGRRRTTSSVAAQAFSLGVLAGGGATTSRQGEPFPGGEY